MMQQAQETETDVIVVGGGLTGLAAAALLARGGAQVTLFEKAAQPGGRAATQDHDGYRFNIGAHALYGGGAASQVLADLGVAVPAGVPTTLRAQRDGQLYPLPSEPLGLLRTRLLSAGEKWELGLLFARLPGLQPARFARTTAAEWISTAARTPGVRRLLTALAHTFAYSAALDEISAEVIITQAQRATKVFYVHGGWQTLVDGLRDAAQRAGARIEPGTRVAAVAHRAGHVTGVQLPDGSVRCAATVILATEPQDAARLVDGGAYAPLRQIVDGLVPVQVACLDVALSAPPAADHPVVFDLDAPRFHTAQSVYAHLAPAGGALIHTLKYRGSGAADAPADRRDLERLLDALQPGWRTRLVHQSFLPSMMVSGAMPRAATGGLAGRPAARVPGLAGLYLAGDWVGDSGYLADACAASARTVARLLLGGELAAARAVDRNLLTQHAA